MKDGTKISKDNKIEEEKYFNASNAESSGIIELDESEDIEQIEYTEEYEKKNWILLKENNQVGK